MSCSKSPNCRYRNFPQTWRNSTNALEIRDKVHLPKLIFSRNSIFIDVSQNHTDRSKINAWVWNFWNGQESNMRALDRGIRNVHRSDKNRRKQGRKVFGTRFDRLPIGTLYVSDCSLTSTGIRTGSGKKQPGISEPSSSPREEEDARSRALFPLFRTSAPDWAWTDVSTRNFGFGRGCHEGFSDTRATHPRDGSSVLNIVTPEEEAKRRVLRLCNRRVAEFIDTKNHRIGVSTFWHEDVSFFGFSWDLGNVCRHYCGAYESKNEEFFRDLGRRLLEICRDLPRFYKIHEDLFGTFCIFWDLINISTRIFLFLYH